MLIYASSCQKYFAAHGEAFIASAEKCGHTVKIDMVDDFPEWRERMDFKKEKVFACDLRWMRLPDLLEKNDVLVCDIDSIINQPIKFECDMALFFRPWIPSKEHKILLTASYWSKKSKPFAEELRRKLLAGPMQWMDDQIHCWETYNEIGHRFDIKRLSESFVNYHFDRDAPIWTCKGPARKDNETYLARKSEYVKNSPIGNSILYDKGEGIAGSIAI